MTLLDDSEQRLNAIDPRHSCIVRAPAGSGKTQLLIQRYLALLATVDDPAQILAITFTRKAAEEMKQRVLAALRRAQQAPENDAAAHELKLWRLARAALERDKLRNWQLMTHSYQLNIKTIDSFNGEIVRGMPWLSRLGAAPGVSEQPGELYRLAVEQVVHLHHDNDALNRAVALLLRHLDNRADILCAMLVNLLQRRDQWLRLLGGDSASVRQRLEQALNSYVAAYLEHLSATLDDARRQELLELGRFAASNCAGGERELCVLASVATFPACTGASLPVWRAFADLLLTATGARRRRYDKNCGFPAGKKEPFAGMKKRMQEFAVGLSEDEIKLWHGVRHLAAGPYGEGQWQVLQALLQLLPQAVARLWLVFRAEGAVDFSEIALRARTALGDEEQPGQQLLRLDWQLRHILVDEFQDTSRLQFELLHTLTSGWQPGDGRTLFIVGDPMQSIYRFREAEVGLFLAAAASGVGAVRLRRLQLTSNFRSQAGLVEWFNSAFARIFPANEDLCSGAVSYTAVTAQLARQEQAVTVCPAGAADSVAEAEQVVELVQNIGRDYPGESVAILVRSRSHLRDIIPMLRAADIHFYSHDVDPLAASIAVRDVVALVRALLHPADNLSWLALLRAPWCGLLLTDLHHFARADKQGVFALMCEEQVLARLSEDGRRRVEHVAAVMAAALRRRGCCTVRALVEDAWYRLGGDKCYPAHQCADALRVFQLLERLDYGGDLSSLEILDEAVEQLYASAAVVDVDNPVQVMTIHKAKGLEFDHVIIPALGRRPRAQDSELLRWYDHPGHGLLLAPIAARGSREHDPVYRMLGAMEQERIRHEAARLLYVAVTRARRRLYLFGHAVADSKGQPRPASGSLLEYLWPVVEHHFHGVEAPLSAAAPPAVSGALWRLAHVPVTTATLPAAAADCAGILSTPDSAAIVGTITHQWLERIAVGGLPGWDNCRIAAQAALIERQLRVAGLSETLVPAARENIIAMLQTTLASERGRWILQAHPQQRCEYPLNVVVDDEVVSMRIDRTFVCDSIRWIIDYKTAAAVPGTSMAEFYAAQKQRHSQQMYRYYLAMRRLDSSCECRCGLYFPACDGWCEYEMTENGDDEGF